MKTENRFLSHGALFGLFGAMLTIRFLYPFFQNPYGQIWSDMVRHWENGRALLDPVYVNSADPKIYQLWIFLVRFLAADDNYNVIAFLTGLLCAAMPYFWYRALAEITPRNTAMMLSVVIGLHPSLLVIYNYFMNETIALTATSLALWMTLRHERLQTNGAALAAIFCWLIAGFSKQTLALLMVIGIAYVLATHARKRQAILWGAGMFVALAIPAGWHTYHGAYVFAPLGYTGREPISLRGGHQTYDFDLKDGPRNWHYSWSSSAFYTNPLTPFGQYTTYRAPGAYTASIDLTKGREDWNRAFEEADAQHTRREVKLDVVENIIYFVFGPSWPDSWNNPERPLQWLNFHLRWCWPICIALILFLAPVTRLDRARMLIVAPAVLMILVMFFQQTGVMEGRYRKLLEPYLLVGAWFLATAWLRDRHGTLTIRKFFQQLFIDMPLAALREKPRKKAVAHA